MKVSEAINKLEVCETVWVKGTVNEINYEDRYIRAENTKTSIYLDGNAEISLEEPQAEKVEVPDYVAEWYESNKHKLERAIIDVACSMEKGEFPYNLPFEDWFIDPENHPIETLIRMKDGYTVKPKRWVVKFNDAETDFYFMGWSDIYKTVDNPFVPNGYKEKDKDRVFMFDDRAKAEAVAALVEGSVEEV